MRVIEPHHFHEYKKKKNRKKPVLALAIPTAIGLLVFGYIFYGQNLVGPDEELPVQQIEEQPAATGEVKSPVLKQFTDDEFKELYSTFAYPNTQRLLTNPVITGNKEADERIIELAKVRGYQLSSVPVSNIVKIEEPYLTDNDLLQQNAKLGWDQLKAAAESEGVPLQITSAYRSIELQRSLFLRRMQDKGITAPGIADGYSDAAVDELLTVVAPPGFSRHHNGYTIDLACGGIGLHGFKNTECYEWLSRNNFEAAKRAGWVPSYPEKAALQGPEPEPWEFIWVGTINLYE